MNNQPIRVMIVDDHEVVRNGLRTYLKTQPGFEVVAEASSGEEAIHLAEESSPDVVLMDLVMEGMDGVRATQEVKRVCPSAQVVVLTSYHQDEYIFPALQAGAVSYILKDVRMEELAETIRLAADGEITLHPKVAARVINEIHDRSSRKNTSSQPLTSREMDVLKLIALGMTNSEIAEELVISENTVKSHVRSILSKLDVFDRTQAAVYAWQKGIVYRSLR